MALDYRWNKESLELRLYLTQSKLRDFDAACGVFEAAADRRNPEGADAALLSLLEAKADCLSEINVLIARINRLASNATESLLCRLNPDLVGQPTE